MNQRIWDVIFGSVHDQMGSAEAHYLNVSMFVQWISAIAVILLVLTYHAELRWKRRLLFLPLSAAVFAEYLTYQYYMYQAELFRYKIPIFASLYLALLLTVALLCKGKLHEIITRISAALIIAHLSQELKITCSILSSWITALQCYQHIPRMVRIILWELLPVAAVLLLLYFARPPARLPVRCWNLMLLFCGAFLLSRWIELLPVPHGDPHLTVQWHGWQDVLHSLSFLFENLAMLLLCLIGCCIRKYTEKMDTMYSTISQQKQELDRVRQEYQAFSMLRHDYKNQLICVQTLLQQNEPDKATAYLETLTKKHLETSKNYVFRGGGVGRSPTHSPFAFRRKAKGEV
ncbi:MAG: Spo0B domain-containing protein, partial [Oscillospiraceae bacterium]|nr:Spo0B domain-containing protein [Oscillospiraceae bacterium]